ncbi:hypothetical protein L6164_023066 [Bauhinia variegata]|uniref:Uncharacterized protein n=1 Tax=Bauhinia variegata TaxID=167791 RepID=A0ACB9MJ01_BAUVA|nr:hypothetical protein L6164_023066 [Bauhinia variegata]
MEMQERMRELQKKKEKEEEEEKAPPLMAMNHVSRVCRNMKDSVDFYTKVLGFVLVERPQVLDFEGAWLFNYGIGIHLVQSKNEEKLPSDTQYLDPMDNHISFQCEDMEAMDQKLKDMNVKYMKRTMEEEEDQKTKMDQIFFNDPDGFMVEICNCENLKLVPAGLLGQIKLPSHRHNSPLQTNHDIGHGKE